MTVKKKITVIDINLEQGEGVTQPVPITIPTSNEDNDPIETDKVSNPETGSSLIFILLI